MIWGLTLEPGCIYTRTVNTETHLSLATLDCRGKVFAGTDPVKVSHVVLKTNDCEQLLCSLVQGLVLQQQLDLKVMPNEEVAFSNQGNCCVYITGYSIETDFNDFKLDDSPPSICQSERSTSENPASTYEVNAAWETDEELIEATEEDSDIAVGLTTTEIRERYRESGDDVDVVGNIDEEQTLTSNDKPAGTPEVTVPCPDEDDVFCIAVKEEPEDSEEGKPEVSNDAGVEGDETAPPGTQPTGENTSNVNTASQVEEEPEEESESGRQISVSESLSPTSLREGIDQHQDVTRVNQLLSDGPSGHHGCRPDDRPGCRPGGQSDSPAIRRVDNSSEISGAEHANKPPHYSSENQQKSTPRKASRHSGPTSSGPCAFHSRMPRRVPSLQASPATSKHQRPPTVAEMISKVGHRRVAPSQFSERRGEVNLEQRLDLFGRSPRDFRLQFPSYDSSGRESRFQCRYCSKTLNCRRSLIHHEMIHTGDKPFSCRFCEKSFIQKSQWKVHERIHTGVKPFVCKLCGKAFSRLYNKRMHAKTCKNFNSFNAVQRETPD